MGNQGSQDASQGRQGSPMMMPLPEVARPELGLHAPPLAQAIPSPPCPSPVKQAAIDPCAGQKPKKTATKRPAKPAPSPVANLERRQAEAAAKAKQQEEERLAKLGPLGRPGAKLQVELENGWVDCSLDEVKQVCDHVAGGAATFAIQARGAMYKIDFSNPQTLTQKNVATGKTRKLRIASGGSELFLL